MALYSEFVLPAVIDSTPSTNANITSATIGTTASSILAANTNRKGFSIRNTSSRILNIGFSSSVTMTNAYFVAIAANGYFEWSFNSVYTGTVFAIANGASATAQVMELIP